MKTGHIAPKVSNAKVREKKSLFPDVFMHAIPTNGESKCNSYINTEFLFKTFLKESQIKPSERKRALGLGSDNPNFDFCTLIGAFSFSYYKRNDKQKETRKH